MRLNNIEIKFEENVKKEIDYFFQNAYIENNEYIILGTCKMLDGIYFVDAIVEYSSFGNEDLVIFDPCSQIKFLKWCVINHKIPVVIHNHLYKKDDSFSKPDEIFLYKFYQCYRKLGGQGCIVSGLVNLSCDLNLYVIVGG